MEPRVPGRDGNVAPTLVGTGTSIGQVTPSGDAAARPAGPQPETGSPADTAIPTSPVSLSWSQIETLQSCGEKYRLSRVLKAPRVPAWWFIGGSLVHEITEYVDAARYAQGHLLVDEDITAVTLARLACLVSESDETEPDRARWGVAGSVNAPQAETWWAAEAPRQVIGWRDWLAASGMDIWQDADGHVAIELDMSGLVDGVQFRAIADRVLVDRNAPLVVDLKTGSRTPVTPFQLASQAVMIELTRGLRVDYGAFYMTRKGTLTAPMDLRPAKARVTELIRAARDTIDRGNFMPVVSDGCRPCGVRKYCSIMGGDPAPLEALKNAS